MIHPIPHISPQEVVAALGAICRALTEPARAQQHTVAAAPRDELPVSAVSSPMDVLVFAVRAVTDAQARHPQGLQGLR